MVKLRCGYTDDRHQDLLQQRDERQKNPKKTKHSKPDKTCPRVKAVHSEYGEHFNVEPFYSATMSKNERRVKASPCRKGFTVQLSMHIHIYHSKHCHKDRL